jgi:thiol-disulfide isomerase/thioredoxin
MKQKIVQSLAALLMISAFANAQEIPIGEKVPDLVFTKFFNYDKSQLSLKDLRGKLVILDFWATNCSGCIKGFPKVDSIQRLFNERIQYLLVCRESNDSLKKFFAKRRLIKIPTVPMITSDTILWKLFPSDGLPYHVWVDKDGVVSFKVSSASTTKVSIENFLNGKKMDLVAYHDRKSIPGLVNEFYETSLQTISYITKCISFNKKEFSNELKDRSAVIGLKCTPVPTLFDIAFSDATTKFHFAFQKEFIVKDSSKFFLPATVEDAAAWNAEHYYDYLLLVSKEKEKEKFAIMRQDLLRYFNIDAKVEKRIMKGFVLTKFSGMPIPCINGKPEDEFFVSTLNHSMNSSFRYLKNKPFSLFSMRLGTQLQYKYNRPFKDETGYTGNVDIGLSAEAFEGLNIDRLNKELLVYGIKLVEKELEVEVLVLKEK